MNKTLGAMAQALLKSWFVEFDPVKVLSGQMPEKPPSLSAHALRKAGFPDRFQSSDLREIPDGWQTKTIGDIAERVAMGPFGYSIKVETFVSDEDGPARLRVSCIYLRLLMPGRILEQENRGIGGRDDSAGKEEMTNESYHRRTQEA